MSSHYRVLEFIPDPFLGLGVAYGALVKQQGRVMSALAERVPGADCLGGQATARALAYCRNLAASLDSFDALPLWAGPQVRLGPIRDVPAGVENPAQWVVAHVLPRAVEGKPIGTVRSPRRVTVAETFLRSLDVLSIVNRRFQPVDFYRERLSTRSAQVPAVSHFVSRGERLVLLEAIRVSEPKDVQTVTTTFLAYGELLRQLGVRENTERLAYLLPGNETDSRDAVIEQLTGATDRIIDVGNASGRTEFRNHLNDVARDGPFSLH